MRLSLLLALVLMSACSARMTRQKEAIVKMVVRNEELFSPGKQQADTLRTALDSLVMAWPAAISRKKRLAIERYIAVINFTNQHDTLDCRYKEVKWDTIRMKPHKERLKAIFMEFNHEDESMSPGERTEAKVHWVNAQLSLGNLAADVAVQHWRMSTELAAAKTQHQNQCQLLRMQFQVALTAERERRRQEALVAGAEVKACFPRVTRKVLKK